MRGHELIGAAALVVAMLAMAPPAHAAACVNGVYHAGCTGPNGTAVVRKPPPATATKCAAGAYHAGCVGPNGAAVVHRP